MINFEPPHPQDHQFRSGDEERWILIRDERASLFGRCPASVEPWARRWCLSRLCLLRCAHRHVPDGPERHRWRDQS